MKKITVSEYLIQRLHEIGVRHLFSVPGDYVVPFLQAVDASKLIQRIGNTNEMEAGYATDGYARINGIGAVAVTHGVGAFSLINTVAGASVENVRMVVINGSPANFQAMEARDIGLLWHHQMPGGYSRDLEAYRNITAAAVQIDDPVRAPLDIDSALSACLTESQPVYLEIFADMYDAPCDPPRGPLPSAPLATLAANLAPAVAAAAALIKGATHPVIWGGVEVQRQGCQDAFEAFVKQTGIPFTTDLLGKSIVSESNPLFGGVFDGQSSTAATSALLNAADCLIALGAWTTDINLLGVAGEDIAGVKPWGDDEISAARGAVRVGTAYFPQVDLGDFIAALGKALKGYRNPAPFKAAPAPKIAVAKKNDALTFDNFFGRMHAFVDDSMSVVADIGFSVLGAMDLPIRYRSGFVSQAAWASIGYAAPAALGIQYALPAKRPVIFAGDGAFHMTCQVIGTMARLKQSPVLFVMNNGIYGVEQWLVNASVFKAPGNPKKVLDINQLMRWEFSQLAGVFTYGKGYRVETIGELDTALADIGKHPRRLAIVDVRLPEMSYPANAAWKINTPATPALSRAQKGIRNV